MRKRAALVASLIVSLVAHAAALAALSTRAPDRGRGDRTIDVELLARAAPAGGVGLSPGGAQRPGGPGLLPRRDVATAGEPAPKDGAAAAPGAPGEPAHLGPRVSRATRAARKVAAVAREPAEDRAPRPPGDGSVHAAGAGDIAAIAPGPAGAGEGGSPVTSGDGGPAVQGGGHGHAGPGGGGSPTEEMTGWKRAEQAERRCVEGAVRLPASLRGFVSRTLSVKFLVAPNGTPSDLQILGSVPDERVGRVIWQAIQACRWTPATDGQGRPAKMWIVMPIRFERG